MKIEPLFLLLLVKCFAHWVTKDHSVRFSLHVALVNKTVFRNDPLITGTSYAIAIKVHRDSWGDCHFTWLWQLTQCM